MFIRKIIVLFVVLTATNIIHGQTIEPTYAEKLSFPKGAKVLIIDVDDAGMSFDSNEGAVEALTKGAATSCSVMMPCSWVPAFVHFLKQHPNIDAGLDLTLTSEWSEYRWAPIAGKTATPGLTDSEGDLWPTFREVIDHASPDEVGKEISAQLDRARSMGFEPTHLDPHMGTLLGDARFLDKYVRLGIENHIPVMFPGGDAVLIQQQMKAVGGFISLRREIGNTLWAAGLPVLDDLYNYSYDWKISGNTKTVNKKIQAYNTQKYIDALKLLKPGITMMIVHCTEPSEIFKHISDTGPSRKADLLAMLDLAFKKALEDEGIILTTWRELKERRMKLKD